MKTKAIILAWILTLIASCFFSLICFYFFVKDSEQPWLLQADGKRECGQDDDDWWRNRERSTQVWFYLSAVSSVLKLINKSIRKTPIQMTQLIYLKSWFLNLVQSRQYKHAFEITRVSSLFHFIIFRLLAFTKPMFCIASDIVFKCGENTVKIIILYSNYSFHQNFICMFYL